MLKFLKYVLATIVGLFIFSLICLLILAGIISTSAVDKTITIKKNSILEMRLEKPIVEREYEDPFADLGFTWMGLKSSIGLDEIKRSIRKAKEDENIDGIYLNISFLNAGMATIEEIRNELLEFKKSGKFITVYSEILTEKAYYLGTVADRIYLNPSGTLEFNGLSSEILFFKGALDKLDIEPYLFKVGEFKSAAEPFIMEKMSAENRLQVESFLNSINDHMISKIAQAKGRSYEELKMISDSMLVHNAEDALKNKLVTHLGYQDEVFDFLREKTKIPATELPRFVGLNKYKKVAGNVKSKSSKNQIAVIYASGNIVDGAGEEDNIGGRRFAETIREARLDENVKAVVLRINSPGGSALASDIMWREIELTKKVKPVIASMSDVAASGGYYMAMACDTIVAHPNTITGSIGVFGLMANFENFLKNKLGITVDRVKTGQFSDIPTVTRKLTDYEKRVIQNEVERIYTDFTAKAAKGRRMSESELRKYASGRVWTGLEAKERKLVDVLGGLDVAIEIAAKKARLADDYKLKSLPKQKNILEELFFDMKEDAEVKFFSKHFVEVSPYIKAMKEAKQMEGIQARMPFDFSIN